MNVLYHNHRLTPLLRIPVPLIILMLRDRMASMSAEIRWRMSVFMRSDSLLRLWRYINHLHTYLLTYFTPYLLTVKNPRKWSRIHERIRIAIKTEDDQNLSCTIHLPRLMTICPVVFVLDIHIIHTHTHTHTRTRTEWINDLLPQLRQRE